MSKKLLFLTLIIVMIASISVISATDTQANDTTTDNNDYLEQHISTKSNEKTINKNTQTTTKQATSVTNYEELYAELTDENAQEDTTITLGGEENTYNITRQIDLSTSIKKLVIEGNNKTLDGNNTYSFLNIIHPCNLSINNITIQNCGPNNTGSYSTHNGAITLQEGNVIINNTRMINNRGYIGGAITVNSTESMIIENSYFESNNATRGGALALTNNGSIKILKSEFNKNNATYASALYINTTSDKTVEITDSIFTYNGRYNRNDRYNEGGALQFLTENNTKIFLTNLTFTHNQAIYGSAIHYTGKRENALIIRDTIFDSNGYQPTQSVTKTGTLNVNSENNMNLTLTNTLFKENRATDGAAINYMGVNGSRIFIDNSTFDDNGNDLSYSLSNYGAVNIQTQENTTLMVNNTKFSKNHARWSGISYNAIDKNYISINNSVFDSNGFPTQYGLSYYGPIYIQTNDNTTLNIFNTTFNKNQASMGTSVYYSGNNNHKINISDSLFEGNGKLYSTSTGGAAYFLIYENLNMSIKNTNVTNNTAYDAAGIYLEYAGYNNSNVSVDNCIFFSNGNPDCPTGGSSSGALKLIGANDLTINNSKFLSNRAQMGAALKMEGYNNNRLIIDNSYFDNNTLPCPEQGGPHGYGTYLKDVGNVTITNSNFTNHSNRHGAGALHYEVSDLEHNLNIDNVNFISNRGLYAAVYFNGGNVSINNTNFINNTNQILSPGSIYGYGSILSYSLLTVNNTNFIENGLRKDVAEKFDEYSSLFLYGTAIYQYGYNLTVDNTNFTSNRATDSIIEFNTQSGDVLNVDHCIFNNNIAYQTLYEIYAPGIKLSGNGVINNTYFISNKVICSRNNNLNYHGVISTSENADYSCNVTNTVFYDNHPESFILNNTEIMVFPLVEQGILMFDGYIPNYAIATVYVDESLDATQYQLIPVTDSSGNNVKINDLNVDETHYLYRVVFTQTQESQYYDKQIYKNNTYFFIIPQNYTLSVEASNPVKIGDNTTIKGSVYYTGTSGDIALSSNKEVDLYINGTYISTTTTDENGRYEFNYTTTTLGTQTATVVFNKTYYLPHLNNTTTFEVIHRESVLKINATNTTIGEKINITFNLTDTDGKPIPDAEIIFYIDDHKNQITTNADGLYTYTCEINTTLDNYVFALYQGNNTYTSAHNLTVFSVNKHNTSIFIRATNTTIHNKTVINGKLVDEKGQGISNAPIIIYINEDTIHNITDTNGEFSFTYTTTLSGENHAAVIYEGNNTYNESHNKTAFKVEKLNTTIIVNAENTTFGEKISITGELKDMEGQPIKNAPVILYIDDEEININTTSSGTFTYNYTTKNVGDNYVEVFYAGNTIDSESHNSTVFHVEKINTTTTATPSNTKVGNLTFNITVTGKDNRKIDEGTIIVYDNNGNIITASNIKDTNTVTITDITSGTYTYTILYEGNETYNPSNTTKTVTIKQESKIEIKILNNTEKNVTIQVTATDETGTPLGGQEVNITLPNGTTITKKTDSDGKITVTDTTAETGQKTVTAEILGNDEITGTSKTINVTIEPDYNKIINEMNQTIKDLNDTNRKLNDTIKNLTEDLSKARDTINNLTEELSKARDTINNLTEKLKEANNKIENLTDALQEAQEEIKNLTDELEAAQEEIKDLNKRIDELEKLVEQLEEILDTHNKTSKITAVPTNGTVGDNNVIVTLENMLGTPIADAPVTITNSKGETIANAKTDKKGIVIVPVDTKAGKENITVSYKVNDKYTPSSTTVSLTTNKNNVTLTVDPINGIVGENITLTAHIVDNNGKPVSGGNIVFKLNGKTLRTDGRFDSNATQWKFKVNDGLVTVTIKADLYLRNAKNITASYSGTYKYEEAKISTVTAQIKKRDAKLTVTLTPISQKQYQQITFKAKLTDTTPNHKNNTAINTNTKVLFKINGKTIKDKNGNNLLVKVVNGTATYKYTVPQGMGGITKTGETRDYTVEAVLVSDIYYPDTRNENIFRVQRSPTKININKLTLNNNNLNIKADILDYKNNNVIGNNTVAIKINGKTYVNPTTKKTQIFTVTGGKIDLNNLKVSHDIVIKKVTIVTGDRQAYMGCRYETSNIVKV